MEIHKLFNSAHSINLALGISRITPPRLGYPLARGLSRIVAGQRDSAIVKAMRANQWVINGGNIPGAQLDHAVRETFLNNGRFLFDFYHNLEQPQKILADMEIQPGVIEFARECISRKKGIILLGLHLGNFDLMMQWAALHGLDGLIVSAPNPNDGYLWQNELRKRYGMEIMPASMSALRTAANRLKRGGNVLTGVDRPLPEVRYQPTFFGQPSALPVSHIELAIISKAPMLLTAAPQLDNGKYHIIAAPPFYLQEYATREETILRNAEVILKAAEEMIRQAPTQWTMFYPVWPQALAQI